MWQRWNGTSKIFEKSDNDGASWAPLGLDAAIITQGSLADARLSANVPLLNAVNTFTALGLHRFSASGAGVQQFQVGNTTDGTSNAAWVHVSAGTTNAYFASFPQSYTTSGIEVQASALLYGSGVGGLGLGATHASGVIRLYSGGSIERIRLTSAGVLLVGATVFVGAGGGSGGIVVVTDQGVNPGIQIKNSNASSGGMFLNFMNSADTSQGSITRVDASTVAFNTTSDKRLKTDLGISQDLTGLRATEVHDFLWTKYGNRAKGVFAQDAYLVTPHVVMRGTDEQVAGQLKQPWCVDYSKFVPDLIVGWQEHEARLKALETGRS